jgi:hypothetical protein
MSAQTHLTDLHANCLPAATADKPAANPNKAGYRNPPVQSQFRPGRSGNPAGRPKKPRDMASMLEAETFALVPGPDGRPVTGIERSLAALINEALFGDMAALKRIINRANEHGLVSPQGRPEVSGVYTMCPEYFRASDEEQAIMFRAAVHAKQREANGRFAKGSSGNPGGRPKVRVEEAKILERLLKQRTTILRHGRECSATTAEALMHILAEKAANGDVRAQDLLMKMLDQLEKVRDANSNPPRFGALIVPPQCTSDDEWMQKYGRAAAGLGPK